MNLTQAQNNEPVTLEVGFPISTLVWFIYQNGLIALALLNYKQYVLDSTNTAKAQSPVKNWQKFDILNLSLYGFGWLAYLSNIILDNKGGVIHRTFLLSTKILTAVPLVLVIWLVSVAGSYGT
jgi:hypothetical protein